MWCPRNPWQSKKMWPWRIHQQNINRYHPAPCHQETLGRASTGHVLTWKSSGHWKHEHLDLCVTCLLPTSWKALTSRVSLRTISQKSEWSSKFVANHTSNAAHHAGNETSLCGNAISCMKIWFKFICLLYARFSSRVLSTGLQKALNKYLLNECNRN